GSVDHGLDLGARGARADAERDTGRGEADRLAHVLVDGGAVGDGVAVAAGSLLDDGLDVRVVVAQPGADDLRIGEAGQPVEVLLRRHRLAVLGEQLHEDLAQDRLVVRERPVEVEDDCADRHQSSRCTSAMSCSNCGPSSSSTARSYFSIAQPQKSKSRSEIPSWIDPHSVQPYFDIRPQSRARATLLRSGLP